MTDPTTAFDTNFDVSALALQLTTGSETVQAQTVEKLATLGTVGEELLMKFLLQRQSHPPTWIDGKAYQVLYSAESPETKEFLQTNFPTGIVQLNSEQGIDYTLLQKLLADQDFQAADRLTLQKLCELAGPAAVQRKWLYFTEVENFTSTDLQTINNLWLIHSEGKFGFSVQREIWLGVGKNWEKLWPKIGWKSGKNWTRYPNEFTWNLSAPRGHLPLSNQLRGVRAMASLLAHPAWER
ncbi:GUN4 domain-containing protein [Chroogloeocystis siderophila]|jgi:hypothetical protein|uniref:GUN4 domain-containing protein n=1 Tax=Chroogloeocystis siderophila 5.2 s.c.1 TaxID=247279 RepID=A0A1U7HPB8_9CHRO|nr:GUN4 domain-containing protein [Chroogloeocystis siderophila]OKH25417.1 hypothetical protein NIES1031_13670 [Chroogloeocystis siderophila 5.2 s.c.1]